MKMKRQLSILKGGASKAWFHFPICIVQALWDQGVRRTIPAGTCPTVGIGGHILGDPFEPGDVISDCGLTGLAPLGLRQKSSQNLCSENLCS